MGTFVLWILIGFALFVYYVCITGVLVSGDYERRRDFLIDLIPFMAIIRAGIPAMFWAVFDVLVDVWNAWRRLEK